MSRSFKKWWGWKDRSPYNKNRANRKVRRAKAVGNGGNYKKVFEPYNICDNSFICYTDDELRDMLEWVRSPHRLWIK